MPPKRKLADNSTGEEAAAGGTKRGRVGGGGGRGKRGGRGGQGGVASADGKSTGGE